MAPRAPLDMQGAGGFLYAQTTMYKWQPPEMSNEKFARQSMN